MARGYFRQGVKQCFDCGVGARGESVELRKFWPTDSKGTRYDAYVQCEKCAPKRGFDWNAGKKIKR